MSMNNLARVLKSQGEYEQAEGGASTSIKTAGDGTGQRISSYTDELEQSGRVLRDQGKYKQAEEMNRQVLRLVETVLGEQGKHANAEEMQCQTLGLMEAARVISVL